MKPFQAKDFAFALLLLLVAWVVVTLLAFNVPTPGPFWTIFRTLAGFFTTYIIFWAFGVVNFRVNIIITGLLLFLVVLFILPITYTFSEDMVQFNEQLSSQYDNKYEYAEALFFAIDEKYTGQYQYYFLYPDRTFLGKDSPKLWKIDGYLPSNIQAQIYKNLLLQSERFTKDEVKFVTGTCTITPHGYVIIKHPEQDIYADLWAVDHFEYYQFGQVSNPPCYELGGQPVATPSAL